MDSATIGIVLSFLGGTLLPLLVSGIRVLLDSRNRVKSQILIGICTDHLPDALKRFPDVTSWRKARYYHSDIVCVWCNTLSYALRHCDFVCGEKSSDLKIHAPDDVFWEQLVLDRGGDRPTRPVDKVSVWVELRRFINEIFCKIIGLRSRVGHSDGEGSSGSGAHRWPKRIAVLLCVLATCLGVGYGLRGCWHSASTSEIYSNLDTYSGLDEFDMSRFRDKQ